MKSDLSMLTAGTGSAQAAGHDGLGYPLRVMTVFALVLALAVIWLVARLTPGLAWTLTAVFVIFAGLLMFWRTGLLAGARHDNAHVMASLGAATADIPLRLRTRMPLVLVTGDDLPALFDRHNGQRFAHVGDGAIWLRVDRPQDLPRMAVAVRQWRDGRAPDGVVLSVAPGRYTDEDVLLQSLRVVRQATGDAARIMGSRPVPGYVAVYQRLAPEGVRGTPQELVSDHGPMSPVDLPAPQWYGVSSATRLLDTQRFASVIRAADNEVGRVADSCVPATRAAALASIIGWTQRVVIHALVDPRQPATPWALYGVGWIDCGPACGPGRPWENDVQMQTQVTRSPGVGSPMPWPLPQPLIRAMPQRFWMSPRWIALAHALVLLACAAAVAFFFSMRHNQTLITRIGADLGRWSMIPASHDAAKRDVLQTLVADRDELQRYARSGVPLPLSFGMYRGASLIAPLNAAIASYQPPPPPPAVVTLDSMSLFDSGKSQLKDGSNRVMVAALDMIKAHPDKRILVAGHTDNVGSPDSNLKLSTARAEAVRDWLIDASGIPATQFAIQGYGDTRPLAGNDTDVGRAKNRRVEITLVPDTPVTAQGSGKPAGTGATPQ
ncbi:outer membrane protein OmpA-like peptidoglycan-associated protein [Paraburkholderia sp. HC6.4b]|uniref:OmpA family protein n=1 Tax=unclassified Paraburkholderia TaxID=2615204 RepID=UPI001608BF87|nr:MULTISPECIES: OmpA family protein [unclassified Paraburkholderia]MBB5409229.1 outer membrane protein OmpA-like peptidoglycan-associated protein [Paraburkholderia sp. HC6.4b]MBB5450957.1 outer membrane protein OmpA-like peptidoglycan-associated protein [Paraburkholderia sp. Kb1A]